MKKKLILGIIAIIMIVFALVFYNQYESNYVEIDNVEMHEIESIVTNMRSDLDVTPSSNTTFYITTEASGEIKVSYEDYSECSIGKAVMLYEYGGNYYTNEAALQRQNQSGATDRYLILTFIFAIPGIIFGIFALTFVGREKKETI